MITPAYNSTLYKILYDISFVLKSIKKQLHKHLSDISHQLDKIIIYVTIAFLNGIVRQFYTYNSLGKHFYLYAFCFSTTHHRYQNRSRPLLKNGGMRFLNIN